ncbi:MAG TPA: DUF4339 domain-containing protein [Pyrinomonadaceae bacterium]|jgi:hypothetical protein
MALYVLKNNEKLGPFSESVVAERIEEGQYSWDDLGWREGMTEWQPLKMLVSPDDNNPEVFLARVNEAHENIKRGRKIAEELEKLQHYYGDKLIHAERTYNNEQIIKRRGLTKLVFANDDPRIIEEVKRLCNNSSDEDPVLLFTDVPNEEDKYEVYYKKTGPCFIATATYGSPLAPEVLVFRRFRDDVLLTTKAGVLLVELYYCVSPPIASLIARRNWLRTMTRRILLSPILRLLQAKKFDT